MKEEIKKDNVYKISVPLYTNQELQEMEKFVENEYQTIIEKVSKQVYKDRELIILQKIIEKQQKEIEELKVINKMNRYRIDVIDKRELISKDKIRELAKKYEYAGNGYDCTTASSKESQDIGRYIAYLELLKESE